MDSMKEVVASLDQIISKGEQALKGGSNEGVDSSKKGTATFLTNGKDGAPGGVASEQPKKQKKKKAAKPVETKPAPEVAQFLMCDIRVGRIASVGNHPESEKLYALKIGYGEGERERSVCAGLRGFVSDEELKDRLVVTIVNLKPRKLAGVMSEAMILAGSVKSEGGDAKESVAPLSPPEGVSAGYIVGVQGLEGERTVTDDSGATKFVSGKNWDRVVGRLCVKGGQATYNGAPMVVGDQPVVCALPDGAEIH